MKKQKSTKQLKKDLWTIFSRYIRIRDGGICITCRKKDDPKNCNAGHFIHNKMDFNEENVNCQCVRCNKWLSGNLGVYAVMLDKKYGKGTAEKLIEMGRKIKVEKYTVMELKDLITFYKAKLEVWT